MLTALYTSIITPLVQLTEFFYTLFLEITKSKGFSVIGLSFIVTFLTLPLYMIAEQWQQKERFIQAKLKSGTERIKTTFKGDEQYMILTTFYKQNHYHPIMALRSSFSLLIQIPFFIAAYNFLSNLEPLRGYAFLFINDFGAPDSFFKLGSFSINILPISMTIINCVAGAIYSRGHSFREKIQIYVSAFVFLVLLYNSPAGLVVYWTMNNILSLVKNIFYKLKHPKKVLYIIACIFALCGILSSFFILNNTKFIFRLALVTLCIIIPAAPFVIKLISTLLDSNFNLLDQNKKLRLSLFLLSAVILAVLSGLVIPSILMESEPEQYSYVDTYKSPLFFLFYTFYQAVGFFILWPSCFYALFSSKVKKTVTIIFTITAFVGVINCFGFSGNYGPIDTDMLFMQPQSFVPSLKQILINFTVVISTIVIIIFFNHKTPKLLNSICTILLASLLVLSSKNIFAINSAFKNMKEPEVITKVEPVFHLSKTGKNVIIFMQDRLISTLIPEILENTPDLENRLDGFTFFPNTVSFGYLTMIGTPGIFGGYDYTPYEINLQTGKTMQQKHNEACLSLPVLFHNNDYNVTVADLPYENYLEQPVTNMYTGYEFINRVTTHGTYSDVWYKRNNLKQSPFVSFKIKRNFIYFGFFKMVSPVLRQFIYHKKYWQSYERYREISRFIDNYAEIDFLPELFDTNSEKNTFHLLDNEATHEPILLQAPDFIPAEEVTEFDAGPHAKTEQYSAMKGILLRYTDFIDYLKQQGVYDNTRIIIVSDHGGGIKSNLFDINPSENIPFLKELVTASILFKDFNSTGSLKIDNTFMTNADTPSLATDNLLQDAKNPFTGNVLKVKDKENYIKIVYAPAESTRIRNNRKFTVKDDEWYTVKDNIFIDANWSRFTELNK